MAEDKVKKIRIIIVAVAVVIMAVVIAGIAYSSTPAGRIRSSLDLGQKYLSELEYEKAAAAFKEALDIDPENEEAREKLVSTYLAWSDELVANGDYEGAIAVLNEGYDYLQDERIKERMDELSQEYKQTAVMNTLYSMLDRMTQYYEAGNYQSIANITKEEFDAVRDSGEMIGTQVTDLPSCMFLNGDGSVRAGMYTGLWMGETQCYFAYIGDYSGDMRSGNGVWINLCDNEETSYSQKWFYGEWENDMPNGKSTLTDIERENGVVRTVTGRVVNGLLEGTATYYSSDIGSADAEFHNGIGVQHHEELYTTVFLWHGDWLGGFTNDDYSGTYGVDGYAKYFR